MKKIVFLTLPIFLALYAGEGWVRTYGTENTDVATCVQQTSDGGYIAVGYRDLYYGPGYSHIWLLKTDSNGDTSWTRIYGKGFIIKEGYTKANWVEQTLDGGYVIVASTRSFGDSWSIWLLKTDSLGNVLLSRIYKDAGHLGECVQQTSDGGFIITGYKWISSHCGCWIEAQLCLIKTDKVGNIQWSKSFASGSSGADHGYCVRQTKDGGYIVAGRADGSVTSKVWLLKTDSYGSLIWDKKYVGSGGEDWARSVQQTKDGGYILTGFSESVGNCLWLLKTNGDGDGLWSCAYKHDKSSGSSAVGYSVQQTLDGGYIVVGSEASGQGCSSDIWLLKTDETGDTLWTKTYGKAYGSGAYSVNQTNDGGYVFCGFADEMGSWGAEDVCIIKTDSLGRLPIDIACTKVIALQEVNSSNMIPKAEFTNLSTEGFSNDFYCQCEISSLNYHSNYYRDSVCITTGLKPWESIEVDFPEWLGVDTANYKVTFWATSDQPIKSRPRSMDFFWGGIKEQLPTTSVFDLEIADPIGSSITLHYSNCQNGFSASIYDASGRKIDMIESSGESGTLSWGSGHGPGVYFIVPQVEKASPSKVVLVK